MVEPRDIDALRRMSGGEVRPFTLTAPGNAARDREVAIRRELTGVIETGLATRDVLALEPLLDRFDGVEIAAAALRLLENERTLRKAAELQARTHQAPPPGDRRPPSGDRRPSSGDRRPPSGDRRPSSGDRRPPSGDRRPPRDGFTRPPRRDS